jgi:glycosyltransferase involved in cell wall biosynthesis
MAAAAGAARGIVYLLSKYPSENHTYLLREVRGLRALGFDVDVVSISGDSRPPEQLTAAEREERASTFVVKSAGVGRVLAAHAGTLARTPLAYLGGAAYAVRLARADARRALSNLLYFAEAVVVGHRMRALGRSHVHAHYATNVALIAARVFPITMSATIHGSAEFVDPVGHRLAEKIAASRFICAISRFGRSQLMHASPYADWSKLEVVPLGVSPDEFPPRGARGTGGPFTLSCVGQLQPAKGQHVLLDALAELVAAGRDVVLRLVGDGPDRAALEAHVAALGLAGRVVFDGRLNQDGVRAVLRDTDAFVLASFAEGVPVVLMEAMAMEIPCVATRITGIPELMRDGVDGLLVTPSSAADVAAAVARLMDDAPLRGRLAESGRRRVAEHYDLARNVERLAAVFRRRLAGGPTPPPA